MRPFAMIRRLMAYRPGLYLLDCVLWTLIYLSQLAPGLIARAFFDQLAGKGNLRLGMWSLVALLVMTGLGRVVVIFGGGYADTLHRFTMSSLIRRNLVERLLELPGARALPNTPGEIINRFRDDATQAEDSISWVLDLLGMGLFALSAVAVLMSINTRLTLFVFGPLAGIMALTHLVTQRIQHYRKLSRQATGQVSSSIGEIFRSVQAIQVAGAEEHVLRHFRQLGDSRRKLMLRDRLFTQALESTFANAVSLGTGLILILGAQSMRDGGFTVGDFALFVYYLSFVTEFTGFLGRFMAHFKQTTVSLGRLVELMQGAPAERLVAHQSLHTDGPLPSMPTPSLRPADRLEQLHVEGLTYRHRDTGRGIDGVTFSVRRGSFTVVTGRVGAGKTTLVRSLLGLLPAQDGIITWNNQPIGDPAAWFQPPHSSYAAQVPLLFTDTVRGNILLGLSEGEVDLSGAARSAVLEQDVAGMEHGLDTVVGPRGARLSGGQVQRTAAARMFVRPAELLVIDDLSSALDVETERLLWQRVFERPGATCLVVSHRRAALQRADQILVLDEGRLIDAGPLAELLGRCDVMRQLWAGSKDEGEPATA